MASPGSQSPAVSVIGVQSLLPEHSGRFISPLEWGFPALTLPTLRPVSRCGGGRPVCYRMWGSAPASAHSASSNRLTSGHLPQGTPVPPRSRQKKEAKVSSHHARLSANLRGGPPHSPHHSPVGQGSTSPSQRRPLLTLTRPFILLGPIWGAGLPEHSCAHQQELPPAAPPCQPHLCWMRAGASTPCPSPLGSPPGFPWELSPGDHCCGPYLLSSLPRLCPPLPQTPPGMDPQVSSYPRLCQGLLLREPRVGQHPPWCSPQACHQRPHVSRTHGPFLFHTRARASLCSLQQNTQVPQHLKNAYRKNEGMAD